MEAAVSFHLIKELKETLDQHAQITEKTREALRAQLHFQSSPNPRFLTLCPRTLCNMPLCQYSDTYALQKPIAREHA